jgi:glycerophosphoryl diester phosphodiesterase
MPDSLMTWPAARFLVAGMLRDFCKSWRQLAVAHLLSSAMALVVLTPLLALLLRLWVGLSGNAVLTDLDLLYFFVLNPIGIMGLVLTAAIALAIYIFEHTALITIGFGSSRGRAVGWREALAHTLPRAPSILRLAMLMVGRTLLISSPFLVCSACTYFAFLRKYDINYYLHDKPPVFWAAAAVIGMLLIVMTVVLCGFVAGWLLSIPVLLFERATPRSALRVSGELMCGHRKSAVLWLLGWFLATSALLAAFDGFVTWLGRLIVPQVTGSLSVLALIIGGLVLLAMASNVLVTFLGTSALSLFVARLYQAANRGTTVEPILWESIGASGGTTARVLSGRVVLWGSAGAIVLAALVGALTMRGVRTQHRAEIVAHRGASASAPENTLAAFERAIVDGADWVELDVQETADGEVVVTHDSDLKKVSGVGLKIWDCTLQQLQSVDIGSRFDAQFGAERVPTLGEALDLCKGRVGVNIELKYYGHQVRLEERVVEIVEAKGMASEIVVMSLDYEGVRKIRSLRPHWKVGLLKSVSVGDVTKLDVDFLAVNARSASPAFIDTAHRHGKQVLVWTVNDPVSMSVMISRGVNGIITDDPAMAASVLEQRSSLSSPERLLLELALMFGLKPRYGEQ